MLLNKTQINIKLLYYLNKVLDNLFWEDYFIIMSYNRRELIGLRQEGSVLTSV